MTRSCCQMSGSLWLIAHLPEVKPLLVLLLLKPMIQHVWAWVRYRWQACCGSLGGNRRSACRVVLKKGRDTSVHLNMAGKPS